MSLRPARLTVVLAAIVLLVQAFVPALHVLQHRLQAETDAANGKMHVCPLHPPRAARGATATGTERGSIVPGRIEFEECSLGSALQRQQIWTPILARAPQLGQSQAVDVFTPLLARPPQSREHRNSFARGPPRT